MKGKRPTQPIGVIHSAKKNDELFCAMDQRGSLLRFYFLYSVLSVFAFTAFTGGSKSVRGKGLGVKGRQKRRLHSLHSLHSDYAISRGYEV